MTGSERSRKCRAKKKAEEEANARQSGLVCLIRPTSSAPMLDLSRFTGNIVVQQDNRAVHNTTVHNTGDVTHIHGAPKEEIESMNAAIQEHSRAIGGLRQGMQELTLSLKKKVSTPNKTTAPSTVQMDQVSALV